MLTLVSVTLIYSRSSVRLSVPMNCVRSGRGGTMHIYIYPVIESRIYVKYSLYFQVDLDADFPRFTWQSTSDLLPFGVACKYTIMNVILGHPLRQIINQRPQILYMLFLH